MAGSAAPGSPCVNFLAPIRHAPTDQAKSEDGDRTAEYEVRRSFPCMCHGPRRTKWLASSHLPVPRLRAGDENQKDSGSDLAMTVFGYCCGEEHRISFISAVILPGV